MIHKARRVYESLPPSARRIAGAIVRSLPVRVRYGSVFTAALQEARSAGWLAVDVVSRFQSEKLARLGAAAWRSEYWSERLSAAGVARGELTLSDLLCLTPISKSDVMMHVESMMDPASIEASRKWVTTGGTTGAPLGLWIDKDASVIDWAYTVAAWERVGFRLDEPRVVLRGVRLGNDARELTTLEPLRRELYVSVFDMDEANLPRIREVVRDFGARFIHGYPSAMEVLGRSFHASGEGTPAVEGLLAVSENLYPGQREYLEGLFGCRLFSFYGMSEKACFAAECELSAELHIEPLYGIVELLDALGTPIVEPGVRGEIVATGLVSSAVPLLRYRTGDYAMWSAGECACGRTSPRLVSVEGRWAQEYLVTSSGSRVFMSAINVHSAVFDNVQRFRFVQHRPGSVELELLPGEKFDELQRLAILDELKGKLQGQIDVQARLVDSLPLSPRGKHRFIEQLIS